MYDDSRLWYLIATIFSSGGPTYGIYVCLLLRKGTYLMSGEDTSCLAMGNFMEALSLQSSEQSGLSELKIGRRVERVFSGVRAVSDSSASVFNLQRKGRFVHRYDIYLTYSEMKTFKDCNFHANHYSPSSLLYYSEIKYK